MHALVCPSSHGSLSSHQHVRILSNCLGVNWNLIPQSVLNCPIKKVTRVKSGERAGDKTGQLRPIEEAIDKMQFDVVDLLILSVGRVEDDTDVIPVRAAFSKL
jgi:hypothetical protein